MKERLQEAPNEFTRWPGAAHLGDTWRHHSPMEVLLLVGVG